MRLEPADAEETDDSRSARRAQDRAACPDRPHPLSVLHAAGVRCSVSTDDPALFDITLTDEYAVAAGLGVDGAAAYAAGLAGMLGTDADRERLVALGDVAHGGDRPGVGRPDATVRH
ncbi:hypothetical protein ACTMSW_19635 [Micromonospora sp. BQ11]|uniref:hypothetical protein n=1 Tax=Micromonospora sp. BQ11 TaxID=3452212 RepID=UPI003F8871E9